MGIINLGPPSEIVVELARINGSQVFVETGTYRGGTTRWAAEHFDDVYTIEQAEGLYREHSPQLAQLPNVTPLFGDSRRVLPEVINSISDRHAIFWLDGHWSGGETAGAHDECPLLGELDCILNRRNDIVLIDDARLFLSAPPRPHNPDSWPDITEVLRVTAHVMGDPYIQIIDDVIFAVPDREPLRSALLEYAQARATSAWESTSTSSSSKKRGPVRRLFSTLCR